jgi:hypothetical protein
MSARHRLSVRLWCALVSVWLLLLAGCESGPVAPAATVPATGGASGSPEAASLPTQQPTPTVVAPTPATSPSSAPVAMLPVEAGGGTLNPQAPVFASEGAAVPAVDAPGQVMFQPARGGGAAHFMNCDVPGLAALGRSLYFALPEIGERSRVDAPQLSIGNSLLICYAGFTPGTVTERIIRPDGSLARYVEFTIDSVEEIEKSMMGMPPGTTLAANDFAALPEDLPGVYTVVATTPDGVVATTFEVADKVDIPVPFSSEGVHVSAIGHGISVDRAYDSEYIMLSGFAANDSLDLLVFESCSAPATWPQFMDREIHFIFSIGFKGKVNSAGQGFVRIPAEVKARIKDMPFEYAIVARGANSPPSTRPTVFDPKLVHESYDRLQEASGWFTGVAWPRGAPGLHEASDSLPACPAQNTR